MRKVWGFTLVELMVTISLMAIIAVIAIPSFNNLMLKQNLNKSTRELVITLNKARSKAALERRLVTVTLKPSSEDTKSTLSEDTESTLSKDESTLNWVASGKTTLVSTTTAVIFRSDGLVQDPITPTIPLSSDLTLVLCDNAQADAKYSKKIIISRMGTVQQGELVSGSCNAS
ncbi:GspH/FimT family pseudopilin [Acinetobacter brisouii]|uniref:GspH/FimT family pseudopilin n=1 Tax=Acinetobacter brisouii TaxID=396323 RepID=UPI00124FA2D5|nr:GspH/FimT family pseudopilin [Acinetobacter brisouii]